MAGSNMVVSDGSFTPGELLVRKWTGVEVEVMFMMTNGHLEEKGKIYFQM